MLKLPALTVTAILLLNHFSYGQSTDTTMQKLIDQQLIARKDIRAMEKLLKQLDEQLDERPGAAYLYALLQLEFKKRFGQYPGWSTLLYDLVTFEEDGVSLGDDERGRINRELSGYLLKLQASGLINHKQFGNFQAKVDSNEFVDVLRLLMSITQQVAFDEHMNPASLKDFADKLKTSSIATTRYDELLKIIEREELERPIDFLKYCDNAIIIKQVDDAVQPAEYLERIHQETANILAELGFTDFSFQLVLDSASSTTDSQFYYFVVSLKSRDRIYKQKSFYRLYNPDKDEYFGGGIDQQEYYKIFNKVLADIQSPYRLHEVKAYNGNVVDDRTFGIIALTREQAQMLHGGGVYFSPSYESFKNSLTTERIEEAIAAYQRMGLLNHLQEQQVAAAKQMVFEGEVRTLNDVLICFPDVVHVFDTELANVDDPYAELVKAYARISHREFDPTDISDDFDIERKKWATLKFKFNNRDYERKFKINGDWIDPEFLKFMNDVVRENSTNGAFYDLYEGGQEVSVIYLTKTQYAFLRANQLVVFADEWQRVEGE